MDSQYEELSNYLVSLYSSKTLQSKYLIGIAGSPGSGKSTISSTIMQIVNSKIGKDCCIVVPMDGYHLYKQQLMEMPNCAEAFKRRGAPFTFDPVSFASDLKSLLLHNTFKFPSFDHGVGDPIPNEIVVQENHQIILVEGNYLYLEAPYWKNVGNLLNEKWFIEIDENIAMERVKKRHMKTNGNTEQVAQERVETNDRLNCQLVNSTKLSATRIIQSIQDERYGD